MLVEGKRIAEKILKELEGRPHKRVCFLSFNETPAAASFLAIKTRTAIRLGIEYELISKSVSETNEACRLVKEVSEEGFDGVVVQLPLGKNLDTDQVLNAIPANRDIDVLGQEAKSAYMNNQTDRVPPVAGAVQKIFSEYNVTLDDKKIVILGNGRLVGEPVSKLFDRLGKTYDILDKFTPKDELLEKLAAADILVTGIGVPRFIKPEMIKDGVVLIDAGTSTDEGKLVGDIDPLCEVKASLLTPVPGGVGPITVAVLFSNLYL
jgi:methylenetetrahydrofolate dehydrogenase (NADP+) / methenyltetrahydrofolate cyclohydrolase